MREIEFAKLVLYANVVESIELIDSIVVGMNLRSEKILFISARKLSVEFTVASF